MASQNETTKNMIITEELAAKLFTRICKNTKLIKETLMDIGMSKTDVRRLKIREVVADLGKILDKHLPLPEPEEEEEEEEEEEAPKPKSKSKSPKTKPKPPSEEEEEEAPKPKSKSKSPLRKKLGIQEAIRALRKKLGITRSKLIERAVKVSGNSEEEFSTMSNKQIEEFIDGYVIKEKKSRASLIKQLAQDDKAVKAELSDLPLEEL